jgi:hypothetical protein
VIDRDLRGPQPHFAAGQGIVVDIHRLPTVAAGVRVDITIMGEPLTSYSIDVDTGALVRTWQTRRERMAAVVVALPAGSPPEEGNDLAAALTRLADGLWRAYSQSGARREGHAVRGRRTRLVKLLEQVVGEVRPSMAGMPRNLPLEYGGIVEDARRVWCRLKVFPDAEVQEAIMREVEAETVAVERADRGLLTGRAAQATMISRAFVVPAQVRAIEAIFRDRIIGGPGGLANPELSAIGLFDDRDPTAAAVVGLHWFKAAVDVVADATGAEPEEAVWMADGQRRLPLDLLQAVVLSLEVGLTAEVTASSLIASSLLRPDKATMTLTEIKERVDEAVEATGGAVSPDELEVPLSSLGGTDPAWELLQACLAGIGACRDAYDYHTDSVQWPENIDELSPADQEEVADNYHGRLDELFGAALCARLEQDKTRLLEATQR